MCNYPRAVWRLIVEARPQTGPLNMATDEAILRAVAARQSPPTLRLYAWNPPAMTLGRGQSFADADLTALRRHGVTLLRRATGGTAVFHADELTYSVAASDTEARFAADIVESYRGISAALLQALECVDLHHADASPHAEGRSGPRSPVCFEAPSDYEITVNGRKLFGSAQMRIRGGILQHGTLPLTGDIARVGAFLTAHPAPAQIRAHAITLHEALGHEVAWRDMAQAIVTGFSQALNLNLVPGPLLPQEYSLIEKLLSEKYTNPQWTEKIK